MVLSEPTRKNPESSSSKAEAEGTFLQPAEGGTAYLQCYSRSVTVQAFQLVAGVFASLHRSREVSSLLKPRT
jgi:hypothetical protein